MTAEIQRFSGRAIEAIDKRLSEIISDDERKLLMIRKAGVLARLGRGLSATDLVMAVRQENKTYEPKLSAWIMYTEGLIAHFQSINTTKAMERFRPAFAIANAIGDIELRSICAAWMADSEFRVGRTMSAIELLRIGVSSSQVSWHEARGRSCLVLADLMSWSGQVDDARKWYKQARGHAVDQGDIGMQTAILFNSASFRVSYLASDDSRGIDRRSSALALQKEVSSITNLDACLEIKTLSTLVPALHAELSTIQREWLKAITLYDEIVDQLGIDGQSRLSGRFLASRAWCRANTGDLDGALLDICSIAAGDFKLQDLDDLAIIYARIGGVHSLASRTDLSTMNFEMSRQCQNDFLEMQASLRGSLVEVIDMVSAAETENPA